MNVTDIISKWYKDSDNSLQAGGIPVQKLADCYGTPLYLYQPYVMTEKLKVLREHFIDFKIYYSVKANPLPAIVKYFVNHECGLEVASEGELELAVKCGCAPENILYAGPGKTRQQIENAASKKIYKIHAESLNEIEVLGLIARDKNIHIRVGLRVNPSKTSQAGAMRMGGGPSAFGIDEEKVARAMDILKSQPGLIFSGFHFYIGTQILNHEALTSYYIYAFRFSRMMAEQFNVSIDTIDLGGGLGVPLFDFEEPLDVSKVAQNIKYELAELRRSPYFKHTSMILEPGRFLCAESGLYICRVIDVKESRGQRYAVLDGGMNFHLAASGNLGQLIKRNYPVALLNKLKKETKYTYQVSGPLCTPLDTLARSLELPEVEIGDLMGIFNSGAYSLYASPITFLGHPRPAEIFVESGEHFLVRKKAGLLDFVHGARYEWH